MPFAIEYYLFCEILKRRNSSARQRLAKSVQAAAGLPWLIDHQKPDGELLGPGESQKMYSQGIAAIALSEAFGMTQDPSWPACRHLSRQDAATLKQWLDATH